MTFFNPRRGDKAGSTAAAESWQLLSNRALGSARRARVEPANRLIHKHFRHRMVAAANKERNRKYPKPCGAEEIVKIVVSVL